MAARAGARKMVAAAGIAGWFGFNAVMAFYTYLTRNSPDLPDFGTGRIMPMHQQARIFYVVPWEQRVTLIGLALSLLLVISAAVAGYIYYRDAFRSMRGVGLLNVSALMAFFAWLTYAAWPMPV
jgi:hypothetical protein